MDDEKIHLSTDDFIDGIVIGDKTVQIVAKVLSVDAPLVVGSVKKYTIMKFLLSNGNKIIQCNAWDAAISHAQKHIKPDTHIYMTNLTASVAKPSFNRGNVNFELTVKESSGIEVLSDEEMGQSPIMETEATECSISEVFNIDGPICTTGYLQTDFQLIMHSKSSSSYACFSITKDGYKLEVRVMHYTKDDSIVLGNLLQVTGIVQTDIDRYGNEWNYLQVKNMEHVMKCGNERKKITEMMTANKSPKKRKPEDFGNSSGAGVKKKLLN